MQLLLDDRLAPITSEIGFLKADCSVAARAFMEWQTPIQQRRGVSLSRRPVSGSLEDVLQTLLPLTSVEARRYLFIPTASPWVAYLDNGHQGTDAMSAVSYLAKRIGCEGLRVVAVPDTIVSDWGDAPGRYGATMLELYGPHDTHFLNYVRSIGVANDGGKWVFTQGGNPLPFEDLSRYKVREVRRRFTFEDLRYYLEQLGLSAFDEYFYLPAPNNQAVLFDKTGPTAPGLIEYTLSEVQAGY
ncbi:MAG TPA: hypothetical protein VGX48_27875 [Pyrinomonadaceae bacterium]|jgi:hypothetical protein|nr:hypothetical protein [Pyrinomonadaceae bacterium]